MPRSRTDLHQTHPHFIRRGGGRAAVASPSSLNFTPEGHMSLVLNLAGRHAERLRNQTLHSRAAT